MTPLGRTFDARTVFSSGDDLPISVDVLTRYLEIFQALLGAISAAGFLVILVVVVRAYRRDPTTTRADLRGAFRSQWNAYSRFGVQGLASLVVVGLPVAVALSWGRHLDLGVAFIGALMFSFWCACVVLLVRAWKPLDDHRVVVMHAFSPGEADYHVAFCDGCGWLGRDRKTVEDAFRDARSHSPLVPEKVEERRFSSAPR